MRNRLIIEGNAVYEIDEECMNKRQGKDAEKPASGPGQFPKGGKIRHSETGT